MGISCDGSTTARSKINLPFMAVLLAILAITSHLAIADPLQNLSEGIKILAEQKTKVEQWATILKSLKSTSKPVTYMKSVALYIEASAAFNALIEKMKYDLAVGQAGEYKKYVDEAAIKGETFTTFIEALAAQQPDRSSWPAAIPNLFLGLTEAIIQIWKEFSSMDTRQREEIVRQLDGLKCRPFDQIPVEKSE